MGVSPGFCGRDQVLQVFGAVSWWQKFCDGAGCCWVACGHTTHLYLSSTRCKFSCLLWYALDLWPGASEHVRLCSLSHLQATLFFERTPSAGLTQCVKSKVKSPETCGQVFVHLPHLLWARWFRESWKTVFFLFFLFCFYQECFYKYIYLSEDGIDCESPGFGFIIR